MKLNVLVKFSLFFLVLTSLVDAALTAAGLTLFPTSLTECNPVLNGLFQYLPVIPALIVGSTLKIAAFSIYTLPALQSPYTVSEVTGKADFSLKDAYPLFAVAANYAFCAVFCAAIINNSFLLIQAFNGGFL